ncbi:MAG: hypothetical protein AAF726_24430 [Planctomycetota bacterium]
MTAKIFAIAAMGLVVAAGAFLVSKAESPSASVGVGVSVVDDDRAVATISRGEEVDLLAHVDPAGGFTLFEYTADW